MDNLPSTNPTDDKPIIDINSTSDNSSNISMSETQDPHPNKVASNSSNDEISPDQVEDLKNEAIEYAKAYAKTGLSTRKEPSPDLANNKGPYYWWEKEATYESNTWAISFWEYDNNIWQLQATKVELQPDGHSRMTAYSMRNENDTSFPGFQIYREQKDDRYHPAAIEDIVYLNRVLKGLVDSR